MSQTELISRARRGDDAAWETIVLHHQEAVFRLAYLLLGDAQDAEDVAQEAFVRAWRALDRFDDARELRPWLLRIAANLSHNRRRSLGRYLNAIRGWVQQSPPPVAHLGERSGQQWEAQTLWEAVRHLNRNEQEVVYLRYFLELSETEMASTLGIAPGTVKSRLHRAMGHLRSVVDTEFPALREERQI